ncbi:MAG: hypothetical protein ACRD2C_01050 [Acidimicrobiales bacterium]
MAADSETAGVPAGPGERFAGYGVMGLPFVSGHVLAMRRFPASSIGPAYTSVWHRDPHGRWVFWQDQPADQSCPRYFSNALSEACLVDIDLSWPSGTTLRVLIPQVGLVWSAALTSTPATRVLSAVGRAMPDRAWRSAPLLRAMGSVAGFVMRADRIGMVGRSPNGQEFVANPSQVWVIDESSAQLGDDDLGPSGPLREQAHLGDFWIPQRGVFAVGKAVFQA